MDLIDERLFGGGHNEVHCEELPSKPRMPNPPRATPRGPERPRELAPPTVNFEEIFDPALIHEEENRLIHQGEILSGREISTVLSHVNLLIEGQQQLFEANRRVLEQLQRMLPDAE